MKQILILGGTTEAYELANRVAQIPSYLITTALAGRTQTPKVPMGTVRVGGFGGVDGLVGYLREHQIERLIDATHPFAVEISRNAAIAAAQVGIPHLRLMRPAWEAVSSDRWISVQSLEEARQIIPEIARRVFLSIGRQELSYFIAVKTAWFLMRMVDQPQADVIYPNGKILVQRGPFSRVEERSLLQTYGIEVLVTKNSGGSATYAKLEAARELGLPVVIVQRPVLPDIEMVTTVEAAIAWILGISSRSLVI